MGMRGLAVGQDTHNYYKIYNSISEYPFHELLKAAENTGMEVGYAFLMKVSDVFFGDYLFFQMVISFGICFGYGKFLLDEEIDFGIGALMFLCNGLFFAAFNTTRQILATVILLHAWKQLNRKNHFVTVLLFLCAMLVHNTSILFVVFCGIYFFRRKKFLYWLAPTVVIVGALNYKIILEFIALFFGKYSYVLSNERAYMSIGLSAVVWIIVMIMAVIVLHYPNRYTTKERLNALLCFIYPVVSALGLSLNYFERLAFYFIPFSASVFDSIGNVKLKKYRQIYFVALYICFAIWFLISSRAYPYVLYFS